MSRLLLIVIWCFVTAPVLSAPSNFSQAKIEARQYVYFDRSEAGTLYCGCNWQWVGRSGGRTILTDDCYQIRAQPHRAQRTEWEHIVPASVMGQQRQCWQQGGRQHCNRTDPVFSAMEADLHNLSVTVGETNADRSNFRFGMVDDRHRHYGQCAFKVDFANRVAEPPDNVKGLIARVYFYVHDRYQLRMSDSQQRLFMAWHQQFPVSDWERERDRRIAARMGHHNPFVTGEKVWRFGQPPTQQSSQQASKQTSATTTLVPDGPIHGNRNSKVYHLPQGCPSYHAMSENNRVIFASEAQAIDAGYRKAGNCRP